MEESFYEKERRLEDETAGIAEKNPAEEISYPSEPVKKDNSRLIIIGVIIVLVAAIVAAAAVIIVVNIGSEPEEVAVSGVLARLGAGLTDDGFLAGVTASDYVILPEYKGISVSREVFDGNEEEVQYQLQHGVLDYYTDYLVLDPKPIEDGDSVNIDYVGYVDGVAFEGGDTQGMGTVVTIGVTKYIDGFLEQLIGREPGETFDINVTFPESYGNAELAGKDAVFTITVNAIVEEQSAELTDEMAQDFGFESKEALLADIRDWVMSQYRADAIQELVTKADFKALPESVVTFYENYNINMYYLQSGTDISAEDREAFLSYYASGIEYNMHHDLLMLAIAEKEGLRVTEEDVRRYGYEGDVDALGRPFIYYEILVYELVPDFIFENAVVADE